MLKKWVCLMGAACMVMVMSLPVKAADREGSIRVIPVWGGKQIAGGEVSVCRVGDRTEDGFRVTDGLANWTVSEQEIFSGSWMRWILEHAEEEVISGPVNQEGEAAFEDLREGLYLVRQPRAAPGFMAFSPFLLSIPEGENWDVAAEVKAVRDEESPRTGDRHVPIIGAMGLGLSVAILMVLVDQHKK